MLIATNEMLSIIISANYAVASGVVFYVGVGAAVGTIFLIMVIAIACFLRGRKTTANNT